MLASRPLRHPSDDHLDGREPPKPSDPESSYMRIEKQAPVTSPIDARPRNAVWLLPVGGRAYAERNGDLEETC